MGPDTAAPVTSLQRRSMPDTGCRPDPGLVGLGARTARPPTPKARLLEVPTSGKRAARAAPHVGPQQRPGPPARAWDAPRAPQGLPARPLSGRAGLRPSPQAPAGCGLGLPDSPSRPLAAHRTLRALSAAAPPGPSPGPPGRLPGRPRPSPAAAPLPLPCRDSVPAGRARGAQLAARPGCRKCQRTDPTAEPWEGAAAEGGGMGRGGGGEEGGRWRKEQGRSREEEGGGRRGEGEEGGLGGHKTRAGSTALERGTGTPGFHCSPAPWPGLVCCCRCCSSGRWAGLMVLSRGGVGGSLEGSSHLRVRESATVTDAWWPPAHPSHSPGCPLSLPGTQKLSSVFL